MIEWLNKIFGIEKEISVPITISIIVSIIGGVATLIYNYLNVLIKKHQTKKTFVELLHKTSLDIRIKEEKINDFCHRLKIELQGNWLFDQKILGYLDNFFSTDFDKVFNSMTTILTWIIGQKRKKINAFHSTWQALNNLKFLEASIAPELTSFQNNFNGFHQNYNRSMSDFRKLYDESNAKFDGLQFNGSTIRIIEYLEKRQKIWTLWFEMGEPDRIGYFATHNKIVLPILELNKEYPEIETVNQANYILIEAHHQYVEMENCLDTIHRKFKGMYYSYRKNRRIIQKASQILKSYA